MKTFIQAYLENPNAGLDIDDWIDAWHEGRAPAGIPLHAFLGMSGQEYGFWIQNPAFLQELLNKAQRETLGL